MSRLLALAVALLLAAPRRRPGRHLPRLHLRRRRQGLGQRRLEEHRRRRRRRRRELRRQLDRADRPRGRADGQQHVGGADLHEPGRARRSPTSRSRARSATTTRSPPTRTSTSCSTRSARRTSPARATSRTRRATRSTRRSSGTATRRATSRSPGARSAARASPRSPATPATPTSCSCASGVTTAGRRARSPPAAAISHILHGSRRDDQRPDAADGRRSRPRACWRAARATARTP